MDNYYEYTFLINSSVHINLPVILKLNLAVWRSAFATAKLKCVNISYSHIIRMAIPYRTAKFKSSNIFAMVILIIPCANPEIL